MTYYVYITDQCNRDLDKYHTRTEVEKLRDKVEAEQTVVAFDRFPPPFLKKRFGRTRLLIEERILPDAVHVLCFVRFLYRGDKEYTDFLARPETIRKTYAVGDLGEYVRERQEQAPPPSNALTEIEEEYLQPLGQTPLDEGVVFETLDWVERMKDPRRHAYLASYAEVVEDIVTHPENAAPLRVHAHHRNVGVLFRHFPDVKRTLLLAPIAPGDDERDLRGDHGSILNPPAGLSEEDLLRVSRRSYPAFIVVDPQTWMSTQGSADANLALSPEETRVLDSARRAGGPSEGFPLFINGRPGSGKSTVLQYLFADLLFFHIVRSRDRRFEAPPLYLTYSPSLLEQARKVVRAILTCDAQKQLDGRRLTDETLREALAGSFGYFRDFLRRLLPDETRERFEDDRFIDFPGFRQRFNDRFRKVQDQSLLRMGSETAWHVIRSYVKGMRDEGDDYFDPDCYAEHPEKRKTVEEGTFKTVFEKIFSAWYRGLCEDDGYWDDQDLVREVLRSGVDLARHPAVFCDEAQDFTNLELEFIYRLSRYSRRSVPPHLLPRVPFAFAGDPFQTLNPTGFSWDAIRADYHEKIADNLERDSARKLRFNFEELAFNYRSADAIVKLCNSIQLVRGTAFGTKKLAPQKTWFTENAAIPVYFPDGDEAVRKNLVKNEELVIIVPCHEGGEAEYVRSDPFLASFALADGEPSRNVFSPMHAKGLEFSRVVLYKFGEKALATPAIPGLLDEIAGERRPADPAAEAREARLPAEYFFNQLYVGASRARNRLIVIDTEAGLTGFWKRFATGEVAERLLARYRAVHGRPEDCPWSDDDAGRMVAGTSGAWEENRDDPVEMARQFLAQGRDQRDPYFLERAHRLFVHAGDSTSAEECLALRHELAGELREAGMLYRKLGRANQAVRCFWEAGAYHEIAGMRGELRDVPEVAAAVFMDGLRDFASADRFIGELYGLAQDPVPRAKLLSHARWKTLFNQVVEVMGAAALPASGIRASPAEWKRIFGQIRCCQEEGGLAVANPLLLAQVAYQAGEMEFAVRMAQGLVPAAERPRWLTEALATVKRFPENVEFLASLGRTAEIVAEFERNSSARVSAEAAEAIKLAFRKEGRTPNVLSLYETFRNRDELRALLLDAPEPGVERIAQRLAELLSEELVETGEWEGAIDLSTNGKLGDRSGAAGAAIGAVDFSRLKSTFVRLLAGSRKLADEPSAERKKLVSDFLRASLIDCRDPLDLGVNVFEAAAAIERSGRINDTIAFYEQVLKGRWGDDPALAQFARERWLLNKQRQAKIVEERRVGAIEREIRLGKERWRITDERLKDLSAVPDHRREAPRREPARGPLDAERGRPAAPAAGAQPASAEDAEREKAPSPAFPMSEDVVPAPPDFVVRHKGKPGAPPETNVIAERPAVDVRKVSLNFTTGGHAIEGHLLAGPRKLELHDADGNLVVISGKQRTVGSLDDLGVTATTTGGATLRWRIASWGLDVTLRPADPMSQTLFGPKQLSLRPAGPMILVELASGDDPILVLGL